jgi:hypothetical protein
LRCFSRLASPVLCCSACAHFAACQVEDSGAAAALRHFQKRTATGLLYIIAMRGDSQDIKAEIRGGDDCVIA